MIRVSKILRGHRGVTQSFERAERVRQNMVSFVAVLDRYIPTEERGGREHDISTPGLLNNSRLQRTLLESLLFLEKI